MTADPGAVYPLVDLDLARRLERAEAAANARFVEAHARVAPEVGAEWIEVAGAYAMFRRRRLALYADVSVSACSTRSAPAEMDALETFFQSRGAAVDHEVSPLIDETTLALLTSRGYRPIEFTSMLYQPITTERLPQPAPDAPSVRAIHPDEQAKWARISAEGWRDSAPELFDYILEMEGINAISGDLTCFLAEREGEAVAAGALRTDGGIAMLAGASTIAAHRRQGAQGALLHARLRHAIEHGCDLAVMGAKPGSASQRNAERNGFRIAYTRVKWRLGNDE